MPEHWTVEIAGKPVLVFYAEDRDLAEAQIADLDFRGDLLTTVDEHETPLWDGDAKVTVRPASREEADHWEHQAAEAIDVDEFESRDDAIDCGFLSYLFPVHWVCSLSRRERAGGEGLAAA